MLDVYRSQVEDVDIQGKTQLFLAATKSISRPTPSSNVDAISLSFLKCSSSQESLSRFKNCSRYT